jgi:hypothetical protein
MQHPARRDVLEFVTTRYGAWFTAGVLSLAGGWVTFFRRPLLSVGCQNVAIICLTRALDLSSPTSEGLQPTRLRSLIGPRTSEPAR